MLYQALYRKYRPDTFSDVVGQEHITETLKNELATGKISHAYLFTGTRGTGKTSCAKILAKAVNCQSPKNGDPCGECETCRAIAAGEVMDIVELDAASNNGVDDVRELREQVNFAPANARYRVYIIDEVHMLSKAAFNALLKTLEEPPAHVIFILATTEVNELPATILSRCQRFDFRRIEQSFICERLKMVAEKEGLTISDDASLLIASLADGGMRDALSILDLCASANNTISEQTVSEVCGMAGREYLYKLCDLIREKDTENALVLIDKLYSASVDMTRLLGELISHYRNLMIMKTVSLEPKPIICSAAEKKELARQARLYDLREIIFILDLLQQTQPRMKSASRRCEMELAIIKLCSPQLASSLSALEQRIAMLESGAALVKTPEKQAKPEVLPSVDEEIPPIEDELPPPPEAEEPAPQTEPEAEDGERPIKEWNDILSSLFKINPLMASVLRGSRAFIRGEYLLIDSDNPQFKEIMNASAHNRDTLRRAIFDTLEVQYKIGPYHRENEAQNKTDPLLGLAQKLDLLKK
ncbi:MAG: DNA polymerase III subunit gamma/tau [Ruminococcaceae bacterium]|nr:DNA polymerase III subunit gamma/tau [Oscillospiraceae bacterium]